ncbi:unnamed protein product [Hymenolepis diminuta]|uniref:Uncharacterized protein n=1 Tax=Hymenolepis diminuta TaxID=6216 RepID=A0A564YID1_HYMDI|nr:unnamed protein product [Hymenolepis diminuta]
MIPQCGATTRSRYYTLCATRIRWHFFRLLVDLATKTNRRSNSTDGGCFI